MSSNGFNFFRIVEEVIEFVEDAAAAPPPSEEDLLDPLKATRFFEQARAQLQEAHDRAMPL